MANFRALTIQSGVVQQQRDADTLIVGAGITTAGSANTISAGGAGLVVVASALQFAAGVGLTVASGTSAFDFSGGSGVFKTSTGAVTIGPGALTVPASSSAFANLIGADGGVGRSTGGTLTIGADSNTTAMTLGRGGINVTIAGNLILTGTTTTVNSTTVDIADRVLHVNQTAGANDPVPTAIAGLSVHRGAVAGVDRDHASIVWDEGGGRWNFCLVTHGDDATVGADQAVKVGALTITSSLSHSGGAFSLAGGANASSLGTSSAALTITAGAASTWSTTAGALGLAGAAGVNLGTGGGSGAGTRLAIADAALIVQAGVTLGTTGTGNINLPNNANARFQIEGTGVSANVTAANLGTLTGGASADGLHTHGSVDVGGFTTTGLANGDFGYVSAGGAAPTVSKTDSSTTSSPYAAARCLGANVGTSGVMRVRGIVSAAKFTTAGGSPSVGAPVYLAPASDDSGTGAGKLTPIAPAAGVVAEVGVCVDAGNYSAAKTASVLIQPKPIIVL